MVVGPETVEAAHYRNIEEFMTDHSEQVKEGWTRLLRISRSESKAIMRLADRCVTDEYPTILTFVYLGIS